MSRWPRSTVRVAAVLAAATLSPAPAPAQAPTLSVERIWGTADFAGDLPSLEWLSGGGAYVTSEPGADGRPDLVRVEARTGARRVLVRGADLVPAGDTAPIAVEGFAFSRDGGRVLIYTNSIRVWRRNTKGTYYVWDVAARRLTPLSSAPGYQMFATFSPDGGRVAFVRDHDLFVTDLATRRETRLTTDGSEVIINGTADWVYEEELDLRHAFRWSPDGARIAFWRLDQSAVRTFHLVDETSQYPALIPMRYPKAGEANSTVRIGVVEIATGDTRWVDLGPERDIYVAAMDFAGTPDEIWLARLNRHQNRLDLLLADVRSGESRVVLTDRDSAWVDVHEPTWLAGGRRFVFQSEGDGYAQLWLHERDGTPVRKLTPAAWDVTDVYGVDERRGLVYLAGAGEGPLERHVYRVTLDGTGLTRLSTGGGSHAASFDPTFAYYVETHSTVATPPAQTLRQADGRAVRPLATNAALRDAVGALDLPAPEFLTVPAADGTPLNAWIITPPDFDPARRYPLVLYVYGGPGSQTVLDAWGGQRYLWHQLLAREGYLVASVDNRGTGARGRAFKKATYLRLGQLETADQLAAVRYFASLPFVDDARIGIWGWSYGGYMASLTALLGEGAIRAAIAVAPVTDWRLYDTIYTERYMRTPAENPQGYERGAPLTYADRLRSRLLIVHGTGDDNVHPQNTIQLVQRLEDADRQFDLRLYPNKTHSIAGATTRVNLYGYLTTWLKENL